jgi:hypothetical protein
MLKSAKGSEKNYVGKTYVLVERNRIAVKSKNTLSVRRDKLKIDTERRAKPKNSHNLTERVLNCDTAKTISKNPAKNHHTSQRSFINSHNC